MTVFDYMDKHPILTLLIIIIIGGGIVNGVATCWQLFLRHLNIRNHGYPPKYCDADGDLKPRNKVEDHDE